MEIRLPRTSSMMKALLKADFTTLWRNRRANVMSLLIPMIIVVSWKGLIPIFGGTFILSNAITLGLVAIGLMGYTNAIARDRDKGVFQRLRVSPLPLWTIMVSRLIVQLALIVLLIAVVFVAGYQFDHISIPAGGYALSFVAGILGGAVYLALGQLIAGRIRNPETVNSTTRLIYFAFIICGMFGELDYVKGLKQIIAWSPYGAVKELLSASLGLRGDAGTLRATLLSLGYAAVFAVLGIRWFSWNNQ